MNSAHYKTVKSYRLTIRVFSVYWQTTDARAIFLHKDLL